MLAPATGGQAWAWAWSSEYKDMQSPHLCLNGWYRPTRHQADDPRICDGEPPHHLACQQTHTHTHTHRARLGAWCAGKPSYTNDLFASWWPSFGKQFLEDNSNDIHQSKMSRLGSVGCVYSFSLRPCHFFSLFLVDRAHRFRSLEEKNKQIVDHVDLHCTSPCTHWSVIILDLLLHMLAKWISFKAVTAKSLHFCRVVCAMNSEQQFCGCKLSVEILLIHWVHGMWCCFLFLCLFFSFRPPVLILLSDPVEKQRKKNPHGLSTTQKSTVQQMYSSINLHQEFFALTGQSYQCQHLTRSSTDPVTMLSLLSRSLRAHATHQIPSSWAVQKDIKTGEAELTCFTRWMSRDITVRP